jgi:hypothetical protein
MTPCTIEIDIHSGLTYSHCLLFLFVVSDATEVCNYFKQTNVFHNRNLASLAATKVQNFPSEYVLKDMRRHLDNVMYYPNSFPS